MCKPCTCIIIVQIMINRVELHSIVINIHEMELKLYALTSKVGKFITRMILFKLLKCNLIINLNIITQTVYNKSFLYLNKRSSQK